ncbi:cupin domain-containing protein, partial [Candidatus Pacearchaeota archaeon]|nr:cupin domain-containing protein [Candidatus Pacearchaeota archaeon]
IPEWRLDDLMISYAADQGSVGPHIDLYDVFILQGMGKRRWQINPATPSADELIPNLPLRIMQDFQAEEEWILEPGDMLYLPPGVAHHGVAMDNCMTVSIGFRAPGHQAMVSSLLEHLTEQQDSSAAYSDPDLLPQQNPGEISSQARENIRQFIHQLDLNDQSIDHWFGKFITETKPGHDIPTPEETLSAEDIRTQFLSGASLWHNEYCRMAYFEESEKVIKFFAGGEEIDLPDSLGFAASLLCQQRVFNAEDLMPYIDKPGFLELLATLYNKGALTLLDNEYE